MIPHDAYPVEPWAVRETELHLDLLAQSESIFALANGHLGLRGGRSGTLSIRLAAGTGRLARRGRLRVRVHLATSDAAGNTAARRLAATLRIPR